MYSGIFFKKKDIVFRLLELYEPYIKQRIDKGVQKFSERKTNTVRPKNKPGTIWKLPPTRNQAKSYPFLLIHLVSTKCYLDTIYQNALDTNLHDVGDSRSPINFV